MKNVSFFFLLHLWDFCVVIVWCVFEPDLSAVLPRMDGWTFTKNIGLNHIAFSYNQEISYNLFICLHFNMSTFTICWLSVFFGCPICVVNDYTRPLCFGITFPICLPCVEQPAYLYFSWKYNWITDHLSVAFALGLGN